MKNGKLSLGVYLFAFVGGLGSGLCFSKAFYYKGKKDAFDEVKDDIDKLNHDVVDFLEKRRKENDVEA